MVNDAQFARTAGSMVSRAGPAVAARVAIEGGHAAHRAQEASQQLGRLRGQVGDMNAFVQAEAARRRGRRMLLPSGFEPIPDMLEFIATLHWAPEGDISQNQGRQCLETAAAMLPADKADALRLLMQNSATSNSQAARAASRFSLARIFREGRFGVPVSPYVSFWYLVGAGMEGHAEANEAMSALIAEFPAAHDLMERFSNAVRDIAAMVEAGDWTIVFTNFGQAPMQYAYRLAADGTLTAKMSGPPGGAAMNILQLGLQHVDPFFAQFLLRATEMVSISGKWEFEYSTFAQASTQPPTPTRRRLKLDLRIETGMPMGGVTSATQHVAIDIEGVNQQGVLIGQDQNGCEWLLTRGVSANPRRRGLAAALERGSGPPPPLRPAATPPASARKPG